MNNAQSILKKGELIPGEYYWFNLNDVDIKHGLVIVKVGKAKDGKIIIYYTAIPGKVIIELPADKIYIENNTIKLTKDGK